MKILNPSYNAKKKQAVLIKSEHYFEDDDALNRPIDGVPDVDILINETNK